MGAGGRLDPAQVLVTDLSELRWEREVKLQQLGKTGKADQQQSGRKATDGRSVAAPQGGLIVHDKLGTFVRRKLKKEYGIEGGVMVVTSSELPRKAFELTGQYCCT
jgi:tRNA A37 threonylcarbamoyladenosine dehydratase